MGKSGDVAVEQGLCPVPFCKQAFTAVAPSRSLLLPRQRGGPRTGVEAVMPPESPSPSSPPALGRG